MITTNTLYRQVTSMDILAFTNHLTRKEAALLHAVAGLANTSRKRGEMRGCFANSTSLATKIQSTPGSVRVMLANLRKKGFIEDCGYTKPGGSMYHRVVLPGSYWEKRDRERQEVLSRKLGFEIKHNSLNTGQSCLKSCEEKVNTPVKSQLTHRTIEKKEDKPNPPSADSSSISFVQTVPVFDCPSNNANPARNHPSENDNPIDDVVSSSKATSPVEAKSHKKKDWNKLLEGMIFFPLLKHRFKNWDECEAQRLVRLIESKKLDQRAVGYALMSIRWLPKRQDNLDKNVPSRPMTVSSFVDNIRDILDYAVSVEGENLAAEYRTVLQNYVPGSAQEQVRQAMHRRRAFKDASSWLASIPMDQLHLGHILIALVDLKSVAKHVLVGLSDVQRKRIISDVVCDPVGTFNLMSRMGVHFRDVFGKSYEEIYDQHVAEKAVWTKKLAAAKNPSLWFPDMVEE